ncbi:hypothetical protein WN51_10326 [Melipona quadrifasciata]|uniref:Uncharacterized protein n=1 Tax=Melipona quadrifasciata TaxID=166423 RepID=A0A0N0BJ21_9HYME|nr:hypothetical protein WN51_10326 [Melipona quadrifasciata]
MVASAIMLVNEINNGRDPDTPQIFRKNSPLAAGRLIRPTRCQVKAGSPLAILSCRATARNAGFTQQGRGKGMAAVLSGLILPINREFTTFAAQPSFGRLRL